MSNTASTADFAREQTAFRAFLWRREAALGRPLEPAELDASRREFVTLPPELITLLAGDAASETETAPAAARHPDRDFALTCVGTVFTVIAFAVGHFSTGHPVLGSVSIGGGLVFLALLLVARRRHAGVLAAHAEAGRGG